MIETCKDCRHCKKEAYTIRVWDKEGLHEIEKTQYWCKKFDEKVPPFNRCEHINKPIKPIIHHEILEVTE